MTTERAWRDLDVHRRPRVASSVYYYAHMDGYNDAMSPGSVDRQGRHAWLRRHDGNAPKDVPHLHFQVMGWPADGKYWNGPPIDPFRHSVRRADA